MTQIIPCNVEMYAVFREEDGKETKSRVLAFDINSALIGMSTPIESLAECVDIAPARYGGREYAFLHIGGSVDAGV